MAYDFTVDWSSEIYPAMKDMLAHLVGKDGVEILEVGSYEGRTACWFLDEILTGEDCDIVCVEPFASYADRPTDDWDAVRRRWVDNTRGRALPVDAMWRVEDARNSDVRWTPFDAAFIDGDHSSAAVLNDAVRVFDLLKPGGILMFDDYEWRPVDRDPTDAPGTAIRAFVSCYRRKLELLHESAKLIAVRKL
jgi:predicted O-methyltransferase YrrM